MVEFVGKIFGKQQYPPDSPIGILKAAKKDGRLKKASKYQVIELKDVIKKLEPVATQFAQL